VVVLEVVAQAVVVALAVRVIHQAHRHHKVTMAAMELRQEYLALAVAVALVLLVVMALVALAVQEAQEHPHPSRGLRSQEAAVVVAVQLEEPKVLAALVVAVRGQIRQAWLALKELPIQAVVAVVAHQAQLEMAVTVALA
jgi:hypothetical protein